MLHGPVTRASYERLLARYKYIAENVEKHCGSNISVSTALERSYRDSERIFGNASDFELRF
jgi:hypothetical protein